jgi:hypothetical protein
MHFRQENKEKPVFTGFFACKVGAGKAQVIS